MTRLPPNPVQRIRRQRRIALLAGGLLIVLITVADQRGWLLAKQSDDIGAYHGKAARVTRIIDGDTLEIALPDRLNRRNVTRVRLWGVNCPELAHRGRPAEPLAHEAAMFLSDRIGAAPVTLWLEQHQPRDPFSAVLAHVELHSGERLNEILLDAGLAACDDRWPHSALVRHAQLELNAKRRGIGVWEIRENTSAQRATSAQPQIQ